MTKEKKNEIEETDILIVRIKLTERDCPRCEAVLILNDNEQCYECINCGYIDCGENKN